MLYIRAVLLFILPSWLLVYVMPFFSAKFDKGVKVGFSLVFVEDISLAKGARIGHLNFIKIPRLSLMSNAYVGVLNYISGPVSIEMDAMAGIGNSNRIFRGGRSIRQRQSNFRLGYYSKVTARHSIECLCDVTFGQYSTLAGSNSQIWTHGYYHYPEGLDRFRIDGAVRIGNNVYIGASSVISMGVSICDSVSIGSHSSVAKSIVEPGLYVSQPLRHIPLSPESVIAKLDPLPPEESCERAYVKKDV